MFAGFLVNTMLKIFFQYFFNKKANFKNNSEQRSFQLKSRFKKKCCDTNFKFGKVILKRFKMINEVEIVKILESENQKNDKNHNIPPEDKKFFIFPFYFDGKPLTNSDSNGSDEKFPRWGMTLLRAGTMRFRWNEENLNREKIFSEILTAYHSESGEESSKSVILSEAKQARQNNKKVVPLELIHSKIVVDAESENDTKNVQADGIITRNPDLIPTITIADCVPIFLLDTKTRAFGIFHSGWKGTGIAGIGIQKMREIFGSKPEDISAAIGPHIQKCCYCIDEERAKYFKENFGEKCISKIGDCQVKSGNGKFGNSSDFTKFPYSLSLTEANLFVLKNAGIKEENIVVATDCTCCSKFSNGKNVFGSFRRQAAFLPADVDKEKRSRSMTVQAAFIISTKNAEIMN